MDQVIDLPVLLVIANFVAGEEHCRQKAKLVTTNRVNSDYLQNLPTMPTIVPPYSANSVNNVLLVEG